MSVRAQLKSDALFLSTAVDPPPRAIAHGSLVTSTQILSNDFVPPKLITWYSPTYSRPIGSLLTCKRKKFSKWWSEIVAITPTPKHDGIASRFSRERIVGCVRSQDGGGHTDPGLDPEYHELTRGQGLSIEIPGLDGRLVRFSGIEFATVRQIAHEVLLTCIAGDREVFESIDYSFPQLQVPPDFDHGRPAYDIEPPGEWTGAREWLQFYAFVDASGNPAP